ncbi:hypothetical protein D9M71_699630 [compost metagenome]
MHQSMGVFAPRGDQRAEGAADEIINQRAVDNTLQQAQHAELAEVAITVGRAQMLRHIQRLACLVEGLAVVRAIVSEARQAHVKAQFISRGLQLPVQRAQRLG